VPGDHSAGASIEVLWRPAVVCSGGRYDRRRVADTAGDGDIGPGSESVHEAPAAEIDVGDGRLDAAIGERRTGVEVGRGLSASNPSCRNSSPTSWTAISSFSTRAIWPLSARPPCAAKSLAARSSSRTGPARGAARRMAGDDEPALAAVPRGVVHRQGHRSAVQARRNPRRGTDMTTGLVYVLRLLTDRAMGPRRLTIDATAGV
jgi:hypothetical protein